MKWYSKEIYIAIITITVFCLFGSYLPGILIGRKLLKVDKETSYLISSGTAICGGSAIAAVGPVIKANRQYKASCSGS